MIPVYKFALREDLKEEKQFLPTRAEPKATGWDVRAAIPDGKDLIIKPYQYFCIPLGFRIISPEGWWIYLAPRSSSFLKRHINALYGVIDEDYHKEVGFVGQFIPNENNEEELIIPYAAPIGQIIPYKRIDMETQIISNEEFDEYVKNKNAVRTGGFGSTGM